MHPPASPSAPRSSTPSGEVLSTVSRESFAKILRILGGGIWRARTHPLEIIDWAWGAAASGAAAPLLPGFGLDCGLKWEDAIYPPDLAVFRQSIDERIQGTPASDSIDYRIIVGDGEFIWLRQWLLDYQPDPVTGRGTVTGLVRVVSEEKRLQWEIMRASENERSRIGQEIHDDVCQILAGINYLTHVLHQRLLPTRPEEAADLEQINREIQAGLERTRALAHGLLPGKSNFNTLTQALRDLARQVATRFGLELIVTLPPKPPSFSRDRLLHLYRIVQEASSNSFKHGRASRIEVSLAMRSGWQVLSIEDNGRGLTTESSRAQGVGLNVMQNRAELLGGWMELGPSPRGGALVQVYLPQDLA